MLKTNSPTYNQLHQVTTSATAERKPTAAFMPVLYLRVDLQPNLYVHKITMLYTSSLFQLDLHNLQTLGLRERIGSLRNNHYSVG